MKQRVRRQTLRGKLRAVEQQMLMGRGTSNETMRETEEFERQTESGGMADANG